ncbi:MAG: PEGA domain-containing protein [candidate division Zixibacteria bacterium]|nr:PEGA domain-containing protein [Candidatus Tariuqbacter arcticus]
MLNEKEKNELRAKIKQQLEDKEKERLAQKEKLERGEITRREKKKASLGKPIEEPASAEKSDEAVQSAPAQAPSPGRYTSTDWAEIERIKNEAEEEWYNAHSDYVQYTDHYGKRKWTHKTLYMQKQEKERARHRARLAKRKTLVRSLILVGSIIVLTMVVAITYLFTRDYCAIQVNSNIKGATIFVDNMRTNFDTDALVTNISAGKHTISVYKPGYNKALRMVELEKGDTLLLEINLEIDPQAAMIAEAESTAVHPPEEVQPIYTPGSAPKAPIVVTREKTSLHISSNITDAIIKIDGNPTPYELNQIIDELSAGSHIIELEKAGYRSDPMYAQVNLQKGAPTQYLAFELIRENPLIITIRTEPVDGDIFIGGIIMGHGETVKEHQLPGRFTISFGKVRGYRTPEPVEVQLSERNPSITKVGLYLPIIEISASLGQNGQIVKKKVREVRTGYFYSNTGPVPSEDFGPEVKKLPLYNIYTYEMGYAFARRNPPGSDFVEVIFDLPQNFEKNKILYLSLRGLASDNNYLFNLTKVTDIAVEINGRTLISHYPPINNLDREEPLGRDSWPISDFLKIGENRIMVRATEDNKCYYYLYSIEIN